MVTRDEWDKGSKFFGIPMNFYKLIIPSKSARIKILRFFSFIPDAIIIRFQYLIKTGRVPNIKRPKRYTEKIQWYKLFYKNPDIIRCSDKYEVRAFVRERGLGNILNELYAVWDSHDEINLAELPSASMLKATHGSGTNLLVSDKSSFPESNIKSIAQYWLQLDASMLGREWGYKWISPKIIAEKVLPRDSRGDLPDFKFFCFDGKVFCLYVMRDYTDNHDNGELAFFDREFNNLGVYRKDFKPLIKAINKPDNFSKMIEYAEVLSQGFPHVRVDFYNIDGKIVFGEMTFYNASGYTRFDPDNFDFILGEQFEIP